MHASQHTSQGNWHSGLAIDLCVHNLWSGLVTRNQPRDILDRRSTCIVIHSMGKCAGGSFTIYLLILPIMVPACRTLAIKKVA